MPGLTGVSVRGTVNQKGLWKAGLVVTGGSIAPWFLQEDMIACLNNFMGWQPGEFVSLRGPGCGS